MVSGGAFYKKSCDLETVELYRHPQKKTNLLTVVKRRQPLTTRGRGWTRRTVLNKLIRVYLDTTPLDEKEIKSWFNLNFKIGGEHRGKKTTKGGGV